jgi:uncharacterized protein YqcC (DUF446 family)
MPLSFHYRDTIHTFEILQWLFICSLDLLTSHLPTESGLTPQKEGMVVGTSVSLKVINIQLPDEALVLAIPKVQW